MEHASVIAVFWSAAKTLGATADRANATCWRRRESASRGRARAGARAIDFIGSAYFEHRARHRGGRGGDASDESGEQQLTRGAAAGNVRRNCPATMAAATKAIYLAARLRAHGHARPNEHLFMHLLGITAATPMRLWYVARFARPLSEHMPTFPDRKSREPHR